MSISGIGSRSTLVVQSLLDTRTQLDDLQRQLGTGQKSTNYAGLGLDRGLVVGLRSKLASSAAYANTTTLVDVRIKLQQTVLAHIDDLGRSVTDATHAVYNIDASGQTSGQRLASRQLEDILNGLNTRAGDRFLFSGRAADTPAAESLDQVLNGNVLRAGFKQIVSERNQADLGANGLGRLILSAPATAAAAVNGTGATLLPDAAATVAGTQILSGPYTSAGGTLAVNGTNVTIAAGANIAAILAAINAPAVVATSGVTATAPGGVLTLTSANADTPVDLTGSTGSLITEFGIAVGPTAPTNLLTQGAATAGQTLVVTVGANPPLTVTFGTNQLALPPEVSTLAELNSALGTLTGGTASVSLANGNVSITAGNSTDAITVGGTATLANFGLTAAGAVPSTAVSLAEDVVGSPFGFKLAGITSTVTGATVSGPSGSPAAMSVGFQQLPTAGQVVNLSFNLPDGSTETLAMTATASTTPKPGEFTIGATAAATAANFRTSLDAAVGTLAATSLSAASAMAAAHDFFDIGAGDPPMRVAGPPFNSATALVAGTAADTMTWYTGEMGTDSARATAGAQVDDALSVSYGVRGNEQALASTIKNIAVFAVTTFSASNPNEVDRYDAMTQRISSGLAGSNGQQKIADIQAELSFAQSTMKDASQRQQTKQTTLSTMLDGIEQASPDQVASQILALQTQLQASLQTTAMLYKLSIVNYL